MLKINISISTVKYIQTTQKTWNLKSNKVAMTEYVCCMFGYGVKTWLVENELPIILGHTSSSSVWCNMCIAQSLGVCGMLWESLFVLFSIFLWLLYLTVLRYTTSDYPKSGSLRFSQFSGCWLILSVYILMSFYFPFVRLFGVR
jgi:hypothetical protein